MCLYRLVLETFLAWMEMIIVKDAMARMRKKEVAYLKVIIKYLHFKQRTAAFYFTRVIKKFPSPVRTLH